MKTAQARIRPFVDGDIEQIVELSLLAWEPVFGPFEKVLGPRIFSILYPDWRKTQAEGVAGACRVTDKYHTLVAELDGRVVGFIAYELKGETGGEEGHAAARRAYEKAGYRGLPLVRYFKAL